MKKLIKLSKNFFDLTLIMLSIGLIFQSCEKQEIPVVEELVGQQSKEFTVKDGMLVFSTFADFVNVKGRVTNFNESEREKWEREIGFKSQRTIFNEIVQAENGIDAVNQAKYSYEEAKSIDPDLLHSDLYNKYLKAGVIQIINAGTEGEYWDMPFTQKKVMEVVNEKGLFSVDGRIYSVNGGVVKFISDGDFSKIPELLRASFPDKANGIEFVSAKTSKGTSPGMIDTGWITESGKRIALQANLEVSSYSGYLSTFYYYHEFYVQNQERNWLGTWKFKVAETWIDASWTMNVFYNDNVSFTNSWSYHNFVSDFKASVDPETGGNPAYRTLFSVSSYPDMNIDDIYWEPYWDWNSTVFTAVRIGGAAGIYATIPN